MKKIAMIMAAMAIVVVGFGQHRQGHGHKRGYGHHARDMKAELALDSAQSAAVRSINKKFHEQSFRVKADTAKTLEARKSELKTLREAREKEINKVLTPEQQKKRESIRNDRSAHRRQGYQARQDWRDEQIKSKLSIDDKKLEEMKQARKESFSVAQQEYEKKLKTILSKEEFDSWKKMRDERKHSK